MGTQVNISASRGYSSLGMNVTLRSEVTSVEERRINFKVEAFDETEKAFRKASTSIALFGYEPVK